MYPLSQYSAYTKEYVPKLILTQPTPNVAAYVNGNINKTRQGIILIMQ